MSDELQRYCREFSERLDALDRDGALGYALGLLSDGRVTVRELYEGVLAPSINGIAVTRRNEEQEIWREHVKSGIVRSALESAWPFVQKQRKETAQKLRVIVACPEEECHELGARMGADFFTLAGFDAVYIGCNTPLNNILSAAEHLKPDVVAISVTNYLNPVALKRIVAALRSKVGCSALIAVSGSAAAGAGKTAGDFGADRIVNSFADVQALGEELL